MSIQDDLFALEDFFKSYEKETGDPNPRKQFDRIRSWAIENENENERLCPIVNKMREAITLMFKEDE